LINKQGLVVRLAILVALSALVIGALSSKIFYEKTYAHELNLSKINIEQLHLTVSSTASIATYLEDTELANEVINGLMTNKIVLGVSIHSKDFKESSSDFVLNDDSSVFALFSPFEKYKQVGILTITPNLDLIENRAGELGLDNAIALMIQGAIGTLIIIIIAYTVITRPIIRIANSLHTTVPGTDTRVVTPKGHSYSELGRLVFDINQLLSTAERQITEERTLRNQVEGLSRNFRLLFENSTSPIILIQATGDIIIHNKAFDDLLCRMNVSLRSSYGPYLKELFEKQDAVEKTAIFAFEHNEISSGEFKLAANDVGKSIWMQVVINPTSSDDDSEIYQIILHDITKRKVQLDSLNFTANTDQLTQLLNRRGGEHAIDKLIASSVPFALMLLDLNKFKPINDVYGHDAGDEILKHVAGQLKLGVRDSDVLSRWGGDEFIVAVPNSNKHDILVIANKIIDNIEVPLYLKDLNKELSVGASLGIAFYPDDEVSKRLLIENADKAMYEAKQKRDDGRLIAFYVDVKDQIS
jgi:diguanylate cyclase (GGDEF)-like protein/PAS domain S-box-containing protein